MPSVVSGGAADRITARCLPKVPRAGSGTPARYSSMFLGAKLAFLIWLIPALRFWIHPGPEIQGAQFLAAAGLQIQEQLHAISGKVAQHEADDHRAAAGLAAKHFDFRAEVGIGTRSDERRVGKEW